MIGIKILCLKKTDEPLFVRPESQVQEQKSSEVPDSSRLPEERSVSRGTDTTPTITIDDFAKVHLVTGTILECKPVANSDKLYQLQVDMGALGQRQILSGISKFFTPEELIGKQAIFVANLAPRKMMGMESQGMLLTSDDGAGKLRIISPLGGTVPNGTRLK